LRSNPLFQVKMLANLGREIAHLHCVHAHTCPPTQLRFGDAAQWRMVPGSVVGKNTLLATTLKINYLLPVQMFPPVPLLMWECEELAIPGIRDNGIKFVTAGSLAT
jgi:hypothetical protein